MKRVDEQAKAEERKVSQIVEFALRDYYAHRDRAKKAKAAK